MGINILRVLLFIFLFLWALLAFVVLLPPIVLLSLLIFLPLVLPYKLLLLALILIRRRQKKNKVTEQKKAGWFVKLLWVLLLALLFVYAIPLVLLTLLIVLLIFVLMLPLLVLMLSFSVCYQVEGRYGTDTNIQAMISWFLSIIQVNFTLKENEPEAILEIGSYSRQLLSDDDKETKKKKDKKLKETESSKPATHQIKEIRDTIRNILEKYDVKTILHLAKLLAMRLLKRVLPKQFLVSGIVGFDDPCSTGQFIGIYEAVVGMLGLRKFIDLHGNFSEACLQVEVDMAGRFTIGSLLRQILWFFSRRPIRQITRENFRIFRKVMWFNIKQSVRKVVNEPFRNPFRKQKNPLEKSFKETK